MKQFRPVVFFVLIFCLPASAVAQQDVFAQLREIYARFEGKKADSLAKAALDQLYQNPDLLNDIFKYQLEKVKDPRKDAYKFLRDLNIRFRTFQTDSLPVSLGFTYQYENTWLKNKVSPSSVFFQTWNLSFNGNVAFKKKYNPNDFLESALSYDGGWMAGGKAKEIDEATAMLIEEIEDTILARRSRGEAYLDLYQKVNSLIQVSDQFFLSLKGKFGFESSQDFSKKQYVPGLFVGFGAKGWNKREALRYLNIPDYPFALIRYITGTDPSFNLYGATFPTFLFGLDYVIPETDSLRNAIKGDSDPYKRLKFEIGFKTRVAHLGKEMIHFSSNFRWYKELDAGELLKQNGLDKFSFFVAALESSSGLFVSFTTGKLPFDRISDQVYAIGFKYDLGNMKE